MSKVTTNTPRACESAEQTATRKDRGLSRRTLLGALAAAPIAAPALAKDLTTSASRPTWSGIIGTSEFIVGEACSDFPLTSGQARRLMSVNQARQGIDLPPIEGGDYLVEIPASMEGQLRDDQLKCDVATPNRLFGAYFNEDGDAV